VTRQVRWIPREHGAWAILAVPLLLGVAAGGARPAHLVLGVAAISAYLFSVPAIEWVHTRRSALLRPASVFGVVLAASGVALLVDRPELAVVGAAVAVAGIAAVVVTLAGHPKSVVVSLAEVAQATALVPAAAIVSGTLAEPSTSRAAIAAGIYLAGSVLLVRSVIREKGNPRFLAASIGFHAIGVVAAASLLAWPYAIFAAGLLARAVALPIVEARLDATPRRLRPIHIGLVEIAASVTLVALGFSAGF
jgi:hypothetical protein